MPSQRNPEGESIARLLHRAWDPESSSEKPDSPGLERATPHLLETGGAAIAWWKLRSSSLSGSPDGDRLKQAYRLHTLEGAVKEEQLKAVVLALRAGGLEPVLCKGWSVARLYPERGLRPYGDLDIFLPGADRARGRASLASLSSGLPVEMEDEDDHDLSDLEVDEIYRHSRLVPLGEVPIRILSEEHQLRTLALHQLRHGLWRPLWLVDVALLLESLSAGFDWDRCLAGPRHVRDSVECVAGLARDLLGSRLSTAPFASRRLPRWLAPAVLDQWPRIQGRCWSGERLSAAVRDPLSFVAAIWRRWPTPIQATVDRRFPFNDWPRWPIQVLDCLVRFASFCRRLPGELKSAHG
jgi:hypothetical protein